MGKTHEQILMMDSVWWEGWGKGFNLVVLYIFDITGGLLELQRFASAFCFIASRQSKVKRPDYISKIYSSQLRLT